MKLRVKYKNDRYTVDIADDASFSQLLEWCNDFVPSGNWYLSLNGSDNICSSYNTTLQEIGLVSGDTLHVVEQKIDVKCELICQLQNMGFNKVSAEKVVFTFGATNLNDAIELLNMITPESPSSQNSQVDSPKSSQNTSSLSSTIDNSVSDIRAVDASSSTVVGSTAVASNLQIQNTNESSTTDNSTDLNIWTSHSSLPALLLQDGITEKFQELYDQEKCETEADRLSLVIHAIIAESGFYVQPTDVAMSTEDNSNKRHNVALLPSDWKNSAIGFYRLNYVNQISPELKCCVTATVAGKSLVVSGTLDTEDSEDNVYQVKLKISDYINNRMTENLSELYCNLPKLCRLVKDNISARLVNEIKSRCGLIDSIIGITSLPLEVKLRLFCYLDITSVCHASQVCQDFNAVCQDESIWRRLLYREFNASNLLGTTYKDGVKHMFLMRRQERSERERQNIPRTPLRPDFGPDLIYPGRNIPDMNNMPGIIGGGYDLYPSGGFQPGGFPNQPFRGPNSPFHPDILHGRHPGQIQPRRPPGARFDPFGPMPDDDFGGSRRRPHPDTLPRPGFGNDFI